MLHNFKNADLKNLSFFWYDSQVQLHIFPVLKEVSEFTVRPVEIYGLHPRVFLLERKLTRGEGRGQGSALGEAMAAGKQEPHSAAKPPRHVHLTPPGATVREGTTPSG